MDMDAAPFLQVIGPPPPPVARRPMTGTIAFVSRLTVTGLGLALLASSCARVPPRPAPSQRPAARRGLGPQVALGLPTDGDPSDDLVIDERYFVLSYNPRLAVANWVSWRLAAEDLGPAPRRDDYHPDQLLPPALLRIGPGDYRASGFDRGHLCPAGDRSATPAAISSTFVMTNMQPQLPALNRGPWERLETYERTLAREGRQLYIVAGGIFERTPPRIGRGVAVPRANYKIIVVLGPGEGPDDVRPDTPVYAVVIPNATALAAWPEYLVTVDQIERESGYDFLGAVPVTVADQVEARRAEAPP
jgi:endonuclease G